MSKEIANFFWHGTLPDTIKKCIKSYHKNGFECRLWSYQGHEIEGIESCDANEIIYIKNIDSFEYSFYEFKPWRIQQIANIFRVKLLCTTDGWWFDSDSFCLKNVSEFIKLKKDRKIVCAYERADRINNDSLYLDESIRKLFYANYVNYISTADLIDAVSSGPIALTTLVKKMDLEKYILPKETFHPIYFNEMEYFSKESNIKEGLKRIENSYSFHLWNSHLIMNNINPTLINYL